MNVKYPTRCQIVDVTGGSWLGAIPLHTPDASRPHVGKLGTAVNVRDHGCTSVRIELDDGAVLQGCECWWVPLATDAEAPALVRH